MTGFLSRTFAVMVKEFTQLRRDRLTYAMILVMPIVQLMLFGYAINTDPKHLPTAVLVQDDGRFSRSILGALKATDYFDFSNVARSPAELNRLLRDGKVQFAITIPADFTRRVVRHDKAQILVEADATDPSATGSAIAALNALPQQALSHDLQGATAPPAAAVDPFEVVVQERYNPENITAYNIVPGLLGIILSITLVLMTSLAVTRERERGTMESLLATPVRPIEVMAGKLAPYVIVGLIQASVILLLARALFDVPISGDGWGAFAIGLMLFIVGSLALGFLFSTVAKSQLQAMQMSFFYIMPSILLSGFLFPFAGMPAWARGLGTIIPVTHFLRIVRGTLLRGEGLQGALGDLLALALFVTAAIALALSRYNSRLD